MEKNARIFKTEEGRQALLSQSGNDWVLRMEGEGDTVTNDQEPLLRSIHDNGFIEILTSEPLVDEMENLTDEYARVKKMIWRLEGSTKTIKAKTGNSQEEVLTALYARLNTVLGRMKVIIKVLW